jgi:DNA-binding NarL/FixJ family response regulator
MQRLADASPDLIIADISMPEVSGYELCEYVKSHGGAPVFLTAGAVEPYDLDEVVRVRADGVLKKPFESTLLLEAIGKFVNSGKPAKHETRSSSGPHRSVAVLDPEQIRAAVTVAIDAALPALIDTITERLIAILKK